MATKGKRPMRALTAGDKIEAIQRVNDGESKASVARDIGVPESTLRGWCKNEDKLRYMSSRHSTPDKDKSADEPYDKKARYSPLQHLNPLGVENVQEPHPNCDTENCLDLSNGERNQNDSPKLEKPIELINAENAANKLGAELNKAKADLSQYGTDFISNCLPKDLKVSDLSSPMSLNPLVNLNHINGVSCLNPHMSMSFNEIATNLSLIAQLNPSLNALTNSISSNAKTLRSIRSPKPSQAPQGNAALNLSDKNKNEKTENYNDKSRGNPFLTPPKDIPVDDALWYWIKTQQAMIDLTARSAQFPNSLQQPLRPPKSRSPKDPIRNTSSKHAAPAATLQQPMDKNTWLWQYYKQIGGALPLPEDKPKTTSQVPKDNILYSQLTKACPYDVGHDVIKLTTETHKDNMDTTNAKARNVLDNLLYNNNVNEKEHYANLENEVDADALVALEHGEKFLCWLEKCRDPSVTQIRVHQLRMLLDNIKASVQQRQNHPQQRISRRK